MNKFLVIAETSDTGYIVEFHTELETAIERARLYFDLAFQPPIDHDQLKIDFLPIASYNVYDQFVTFSNSMWGTSNGFFSTHVLEVDDNFDLKEFVLLRASAQHIFKGDELNKYLDLEDEYGFEKIPYLWVN